jgi:hypothetical protein
LADGASNQSREATESLVARLDQGVERATSALRVAAAATADRSTEATEALIARLTRAIEQSAISLHNVAGSAASRSSEAIGGLLERLTEEVDKSSVALHAVAESAMNRSTETIGGALARLTEEVESSSTALHAAADSATHRSSDAVAALLTRLTQEAEKSAFTMRAAADAAVNRSSEAIGGLLARLTRELEQSTLALKASADVATSESSEALGAMIDRLTHELRESSGTLREAVETGARGPIATLSSTGERLRSELSVVLERLGQTGAALDRVVAAASSKLGDIQGELGGKVEDLQGSLGAIASQITELDRLSTATRDDSGEMVTRMAAHTAALAEVARDLAAKQQTIDMALQHRQKSLEQLMAAISVKSGDFDQLMRGFTASVEESFAKAQARAQEISASLAAATKGAATTVAGQFEAIRENAGRERERTAQALKETYDQASAQLAEIMGQASEKFRVSVGEVKQMASEVQRELDSTRQELRRGVFELPQETHEAANAMRRVVSDQIKALKELASVVSSTGADFDLVEPGSAPPTAPLAPSAPPARLDPARVDAAPQPPRRETAVAPRVAAPPRELPPPRETADAPALAAPPTAPEPIRLRPAAQPSAAARAERGQTGWLSNLLAAAERDEGEAPPRVGGDPLETISTDIARLVDADAAGEMWERWRAGEVGAVSRRLYTAAGQQSFDDIRRRYRSETAFRDSVNRYVQEFERLLAKIGQTDRDGSQSRIAMLSDSGKVYILLAHASGRLA